MSVSLKQLTAMVDIAEALAMEMRELIALRELIAGRSLEHMRATVSKSRPRAQFKQESKAGSRGAATKVGTARALASACPIATAAAHDIVP